MSLQYKESCNTLDFLIWYAVARRAEVCPVLNPD